MRPSHLLAGSALLALLVMPTLAAADSRVVVAPRYGGVTATVTLFPGTIAHTRIIETRSDRRGWKARYRDDDRRRHGHGHDRHRYRAHAWAGPSRWPAPVVIFRYRRDDHPDYAPRRWW